MSTALTEEKWHEYKLKAMKQGLEIVDLDDLR